MIAQNKSPRAGRQRGRERSSFIRILLHKLPHCKLHDRSIVHELPPRCPMRRASALQAIARLQAGAWRRLLASGPDQDVGGGLADLERASICDRCVSELLAHPHVRHLRARQAKGGANDAA